MNEYEAIVRLKIHFAIHDDGRPTPHLDEAAALAYQALSNQDYLRKKLIEYEKNPTATGMEGIITDLYKLYVWNWTG